MSETTIHATIGKRVDPATNEVTLFIEDQPWGPIVTGATFEEAKAKFLKVLPAIMVANSYCEIKHDPRSTRVANKSLSAMVPTAPNLQSPNANSRAGFCVPLVH